MDNKELQSILDLHKKWIYSEEGGERADLRHADLRYADLRYADLRDADLRYADLCYADLRDADLRDADLRDAELRDADLRYAKNAELVMARTTILPEGTIIGYKKASLRIVKLEIPEDAKRSNASGRKCRCDKAKVLSIESCDGKEAFEEAASNYDRAFVYRVGETVSVDDFCEDRWDECAPGIHFFITRTEAEKY